MLRLRPQRLHPLSLLHPDRLRVSYHLPLLNQTDLLTARRALALFIRR